MNIVQWPDPRLGVVCEPVPQGESCRDLIQRMFNILEMSANGIGLAAPQIGIMKRVIVARVPFKHFGGTQIIKHAFINPVLLSHQGVREEAFEGCLSFPDKEVSIPRWPRIQVGGFNAKWEWTVSGAKGLVARVLQHEMDHLDGRNLAFYAKLAYDVEQEKKRKEQLEAEMAHAAQAAEFEEQQIELPLESGPG